MSWYYVKDGQAAGPVPEAALAVQFRSDSLATTTLVWRTGLKEWLPLSVALLLYVINTLTMGLPNLTALADSEKRPVVDMIFDTRVIKNKN